MTGTLPRRALALCLIAVLAALLGAGRGDDRAGGHDATSDPTNGPFSIGLTRSTAGLPPSLVTPVRMAHPIRKLKLSSASDHDPHTTKTSGCNGHHGRRNLSAPTSSVTPSPIRVHLIPPRIGLIAARRPRAPSDSEAANSPVLVSFPTASAASLYGSDPAPWRGRADQCVAEVPMLRSPRL